MIAVKNGYSFENYISDYPFHEVEYIHISGFERDNHGYFRDTHSHDLSEEIIEVAQLVLNKIKPKYLLVERDFNVNIFEDTLKDILKIKSLKYYYH